MIGVTTINKQPTRIAIIAAFAAIYLIWGSTYTAIKFAIQDIPVFLMTGIRFTTAGLILYFFCRFRGEPTPGLNSTAKISFSGILMLFIGTGTVAWVEQYIPSGLAAIIVATVPLWFVLFDRSKWKYNFSNKWILGGLLIGFVGVILLVSDKRSFDFSGDRMKVISFFVLLAGTISWTIGSLYSKYQPMEGTSGMKAAIQMLAAGACSLIAAIANGDLHHVDWANISTSSIYGLLYLIGFGSLIAYMAYVWLLSVRSPALVGTYAYVNPVVAVFLGWLLANESINQQQMIALAVILSGVILVNFSKEKIKQ